MHFSYLIYMKKEHWKVIEEFPYYEVSDKGRIRRLTPGKGTYKGKILNTSINNAGYECVILKKDKVYCRTVHRLVAIAFLQKPDGCNEINHKDENKLNNTVENLEWCTHKYNMNYGTLKERTSETLKKSIEYCTISIPVKTTIYLLDGNTYYDRNQVAEALKLSVARICQMLQCGGNRNHTLIKSEKYVMKHRKISRSYAKKHYAEFIID